MATADTAKLIAALTLKDGFTGPLKGANRALGQFDAKLTNSQGRAFKAGQQIGTGIKNAARIAVAGFGAVASLLLASAKEGQEAANVQKIYAQAVANSGKVSQAQVGILNAQQTALMNLAGVDDELIKTEQTRLITMGLTGDAVAKLTPLILDLSKSTGIDLMTATTAVGKAALGNVTSLQKMGIVLPKLTAEQKKTATATSHLDTVTTALNQRFGGTAALSGSLDVRLAVLREALANVREEAGMKLLPVMTRIVDVVGRRLVPAFGEFINGILPSAIKGLDKLAGFLEDGGATTAIKGFLETARALAPAIQASAEITGSVIKTAVDLFKSLPPEIQALAVAGLAINKLTGGLVTNIAGGLISAVLRQLVSGVVNVNGAVVNVVGGGGSPLPTVLAGAGAAGAIGTSTALLAIVAATVTSYLATAAFADKNTTMANRGLTADEIAAVKYYQSDTAAQQTALKHLGRAPARADFEAGIAKLAKVDDRSYDAIEKLRGAITTDTLSVNVANAKDLRPSDATARTAQQADREARGIKDTGPSKTLAPRFKFLAGSHSAAKDIAVANALVIGFQRSTTPAFRNIGNLKTAITALQKDQKTFSGTNAKTIGGYIKQLETELARRTAETATKTANAVAAGAGRMVAAIGAQDLTAHLSVSTGAIYFNGRLLQAATERTESTVRIAGKLIPI